MHRHSFIKIGKTYLRKTDTFEPHSHKHPQTLC